jgi:perosamine synthetase
LIRLTVPYIDENEYQAVQGVLKSGFLVQGSNVARFEEEIARYVGTKYAVALSSGTASLHLSLLVSGVKPGDRVAVTAYSWIATANVIELCGAKPLFVDILPDTFNLDPDELVKVLEKELKGKKRTGDIKAVIPVHVFGQVADMEAIKEVADQYNLTIIEDAACALGAKWNNRQAGAWGSLGCFSFHPRKAITTGEGGVITTNDNDSYRHIRALRNHGFDADREPPDFIMPGFNYRLTEFQGALGIEQLNKLDQIIASRKELTSNYNLLLKNTPFKTPFNPLKSDPVYQSYVILLPDSLIEKREKIIEKLRSKDIETTIGTLHMPLTHYYRKRYGFRPGDFPVTDKISRSSMTLPIYMGLEKESQEKIVHQLLELI